MAETTSTRTPDVLTNPGWSGFNLDYKTPEHRIGLLRQLGSAHHAAHTMRMMIAKIVARPATIATNKRISRCSVVIDEVSAEESFAIRPLAVSYISSEILSTRRDRKHAQDGVVADLQDETKARSADTKCPLETNVLCLEERVRKGEYLQGVASLDEARHTSRMLSFVFSKRPVIGSLYEPTIVSGKKGTILRRRVMTHLPSEHTPIESQVPRNVNQLDVRGNLLAHDQVDNVARDERNSGNRRLHAIAEDDDVGGEHSLDRRHDARC